MFFLLIYTRREYFCYGHFQNLQCFALPSVKNLFDLIQAILEIKEESAAKIPQQETTENTDEEATTENTGEEANTEESQI